MSYGMDDSVFGSGWVHFPEENTYILVCYLITLAEVPPTHWLLDTTLSPYVSRGLIAFFILFLFNFFRILQKLHTGGEKTLSLDKVCGPKFAF